MAEKRLIDANDCPALFDEKYKATRQLINQGETHLDNLAEGFTEADRVIQGMPTVDAVEVVRCRECAIPHNKYTGCPKLNGLVPPPDFYCPYGEREPMAEYIEREALMKNFCGYDLTKCVKYGNKDADQKHDSYSTMMMYEIADEIIDAPAADVAPVRHGRWDSSGKYRFQKDNSVAVRCTECGCSLTEPEYRRYIWNYCPVCGAKMDLEG